MAIHKIQSAEGPLELILPQVCISFIELESIHEVIIVMLWCSCCLIDAKAARNTTAPLESAYVLRIFQGSRKTDCQRYLPSHTKLIA